MLSREGFCKALRMIRDQESIDEQFSKALNLVGNGHFVFGTENKYLLALRDVLKEAVNDQYDYIDWWLYEAADDFEIWEADCTMKYCLKEPEALYDFYNRYAKACPCIFRRKHITAGIRGCQNEKNCRHYPKWNASSKYCSSKNWMKS